MTNEEIIANLKTFRMQKNPVSPYTVFRDQEIDALLQVKPKTLETLTTVPGFPAGGARVEKYGKDIVEFFKGGCKVTKMAQF